MEATETVDIPGISSMSDEWAFSMDGWDLGEWLA